MKERCALTFCVHLYFLLFLTICGIFLIDYIRPLLAFMFFRNLTESIFKRLKDNALTGLLLFT